MKTRKGFTLIELLIVVAIIAILAAIAVPNFLEAQVRSKVSRVKADMRSIATAVESYMVDRNGYPYLKLCQDLGTGELDRGSIFAVTLLSTPVAYLTSTLIRDPFVLDQSMTAIGSNPQNDDPVTVTYVNIAMYRKRNGLAQDSARPRYCLYSLGPDHVKGPNPIDGSNWFASRYARFEGYSSPPPNGDVRYTAWNYDPTNGTTSNGDILRWQGE